MNILVTGAAGFIGYHLCKRLLDVGHVVFGVDNMSTYYDVKLKNDRLFKLVGYQHFTFKKLDISDIPSIEWLFESNSFDVVVNLAAQAGVRYSITNPAPYIRSNILGFVNILEGCRYSNIKHLVFASSSSVYGANTRMPFSVHNNVDHPVSLYAATKKSDELMAHSYSHLYKLPCTGLRFFTVYGPYGRPDMALFLFTKAILEGKPIQVFNNGNMKRDFTYIDDIIEGVVRVIHKIPEPNPEWSGDNPDPGTSYTPYKIYNIGNNNPVGLMKFISIIEDNLGIEAIKEFQPLQQGDVVSTYADIDDLMKDVGFKPSTQLEEGIRKFIDWYLIYYKKRD